MRGKVYLAIIALTLSTVLLFSCYKKEDTTVKEDPQAVEQHQHQSAENSESGESVANAKNVFPVGSVISQASKTPVDFTWQEAGAEKKFSEIAKGKVVFVNVWGTWCPPCRAEIPDLIQISKDLKDKDFVMIGVAIERDLSQALTTVSNFSKKSGIPYHVFVDEQTKLVAEYEKNFGAIEGVPTTYIFDKNAKLSQVIVGSRSKDEFMSFINKLL